MYLIYTQSHKRKPVCLYPGLPLSDPQAAVPVCWCSCCGAEVFRPGRARCDRCRKEKAYEKICRS